MTTATMNARATGRSVPALGKMVCAEAQEKAKVSMTELAWYTMAASGLLVAARLVNMAVGAG